MAWQGDIWEAVRPGGRDPPAREAHHGFAARIRDALERQAERWFLWLPVGLAAGIVFYFSLPREPAWPAVAGLGLAGLLAAGLAARRGRVSPALILAMALLGVVVAKARTEIVSTPTLAWPVSVTLTGHVRAVEGGAGNAQRLTVTVREIEGLRGQPAPQTVRLAVRARGAAPIMPGDHVTGRARLLPPPEPVMPGAYDFARAAWFDGLGATGFTYGAPERVAGPPPGLGDRIAAWLDRRRIAIAERVYAVLPGRSGAFAVALMTGERADLPEDVVEDLRIAGLAHLLAISGLHMMLVAGSVFWFVRALLAASPALATRWPIKKWAAVTALVAAGGYLALSGASIATQRAFIMVAIMFAAILADRRAISMRNVALAALVILVIRPESVLSASFQMSFMAVTALIAFYEMVRDRRAARPVEAAHGTARRVLGAVVVYAAGVVFTTLVAGAATAPAAAYHFQRVAAYSLLANAAALPLVSLAVMPGLMVALAAMPLGLERWPLVGAGWGLDRVIAVADGVAGLPGSAHIVPAVPGAAFALVLFGMIWLCLWRGPVRALGLVAILAAVPVALDRARPDVLIERQARTVAVRNGDGALALMSARAGRYSAERWLRADGDPIGVGEAAARPGFACDDLGCVATLANGATLAVVTHPAALAEECRRAAVLVTTFALRRDCRSPDTVIDIWSLRDHGAHALYVEGARIRVERANAHRGRRPWVSPPRDAAGEAQ